MRKPMWSATLSLLVFLAIAPREAAAESFFDLFAGAAFTDSNDIKVSVPGFSATGESDFKTSFSVGGRAGYWFGFFGLDLDVDYFRPSPDTNGTPGLDIKLDVVGVGVNAMLRGQFLKTTTAPDGALQPYIFAGPTLFISHLEVDVSGEEGNGSHDIRMRLSSAIESAKATYHRLEEKAVAGAKATDKVIREHPYESLGIAFGLGLLVGVLVTRK